MKKVKKIKLQNLSQTEMAEKEMNLLKGGGNVHVCISVCLDAICKCLEGENGSFPIAEGVREAYGATTITEKGYSDFVAKTTSGGEIQSTGVIV